MKIKRSVCVGTSLLPTGFNDLIESQSRADLVLGLRKLSGLEIAEPVRTIISCNTTPLRKHPTLNDAAIDRTRVLRHNFTNLYDLTICSIGTIILSIPNRCIICVN